MTPNLFFAGNTAVLRTYSADRFKAGLFSVSSSMPITRENACLAPLLLSVLRRGTQKYPTLADLNRRLDLLWGTGFSVRSFYRGNRLILGFSADLLDSAYLPEGSEDLMDAVLDLIREILFFPKLDADGLLCAKYVESEKALQCDAIRAVKNNPRVYATERCRSILYDSEPCGIPLYGTEEETAAVTREALTAFWKDLIAELRPDCFYVGPAEPDTVCKKLERVFGTGKGRASVSVPDPGISDRRGRELRVDEALPVSQSQLVIGMRCGIGINDPDYYACAVMNELLGGSPISRLFVYVREKQSLCYSCSSAYQPFLGTLTVSCGLESGNRERAEAEIFRQLDAVANGAFSAEELEAAKKSLVNAYRQFEDSPAELENYFTGRASVGNTVSPEACRAGFAAVTAGAVADAVKRLTVDVIYFLEGTLTDGGEDGDEDDEEDL